MNSTSDSRIQLLERAVRRLQFYMGGSLLLAVAFALNSCASAFAGSSARSQVIEASELVITDSNGIVRVRIGSNLPDAIIDGQRVTRGSDVTGVMLYDATGQERSGYVTGDADGNVFLTLDGRQRQSALFVADTSGATALRIWNGGDAVDLRSDQDGARVTVTRGGAVAFQEPEFVAPIETLACRTYRSYRGQVTDDQLLAACRERMTVEACTLCLASP